MQDENERKRERIICMYVCVKENEKKKKRENENILAREKNEITKNESTDRFIYMYSKFQF